MNLQNFQGKTIARLAEVKSMFESVGGASKVPFFKQKNVIRYKAENWYTSANLHIHLFANVKAHCKLAEVKLCRGITSSGTLLPIFLIIPHIVNKYEPVPMSLCNLDGSICKTNKSVLLKLFKTDSNTPNHTDIVIIDGFFLLHCIKDVPKTFGNLSKKILQMVTNNTAAEVHLIFNRYFSPSIKDYERSTRATGVSHRNYVITGPEQIRPVDFVKELRNDKFKEALIRFLILHWNNNEMAPFIRNKTILLNFDYCYMYKVDESNNVVRTNNDDFSCIPHEEADTKIIYHICKIDYDANVVIKCSDTDILVILLGNIGNMKSKSKIWIESGTAAKRNIIDVCKLYDSLGQSLCRALPGFHALTGCDYNPSFYRKGKQKPYTILKKNENYIKAFIDVGDPSCNEEAVFQVLEDFVCNMYGLTSKKNLMTVNNARFQLFLKNFKIKNVNEAFTKKNLKNFDASSLPPCKSELQQHLLRCKYITNIWQNANKRNPCDLDPLEFGWIDANDSTRYEFQWFEGEQLPKIVKDVIIDKDDSEAEEVEAEYDSDESCDPEDDMELPTDTEE
ncbi:uncharacterized protein [Prorops nasuta]|uniref:uncharacterized protein n=1 Tax=Prorops nasuta TaxID=863751 RepID=UPI0034CED88C